MVLRNLSTVNGLLIPVIELIAFLNGDDVEAVPQGFKEYIKFLVEQAGTEDLNPWLESWVAGDTENLTPTNGLILYRDMPSVLTTTEEKKTNG